MNNKFTLLEWSKIFDKAKKHTGSFLNKYTKKRLHLKEIDNFEADTNISITLIKKSGDVKVIDLGPNTITSLGRANMAHLIAGDDVANRMITTIKFGDGGHNPSFPTQPVTTSPSDTDLYGNLILEKITSYSYPAGSSGGKVMFTASVDFAEGNGVSGSQAYSEVGLYDEQDRMITHKSFGLISKSEAFSLTINYTLLF